MNDLRIVYFGGEPLGVPVLRTLKQHGIIPDLIVCNPDRKQGRKHILTPPQVKEWAIDNDVEVFQPEHLRTKETLSPLTDKSWDLFIVVAYGSILPEWLVEFPTHKTLNLHPSLLPKLRGPSPIRTALLESTKDAVGVTVIRMDKDMDHGPILAQKKVSIPEDEWPIRGNTLDALLAEEGGDLLAETIPKWITGQITPVEQVHGDATFSKKITKDMGELTIDPHNPPQGDVAYQTLLKIRALEGWPGAFFFYNNKRVKILDAQLSPSGTLEILTVIPEGKTEMSFHEYVSGV